MTRRPRVAVVGGGIGGLTAARALMKSGCCEVALFDAADRPGGVIGSECAGGFLFERGATGFAEEADDGALALARELDIAVEQASPLARRRWVWLDGRLRVLPTTPREAAATDLLSLRGKLVALGEPFRRPLHGGDESVAAFARRRFGREVERAAVGPLVAALFAGDPELLSVRAALPRLAALEDGGGVVRGSLRAMRQRWRAGERWRPRGLVAPVGGMGRLVEALVGDLGAAVRMGAAVRKVERLKNGRLRLRGDKLGHAAAPPFDAVVVAVDASSAASLVAGVAPEAARALREIEHTPVAVTYLGFRRDQVPHALDGFGFLVADGEPVRLLECAFESTVWSGRAPPGHVLLRCVLGGARDPEAASVADERLVVVARDGLRCALGIAAAPVRTRVIRHQHAIAQYTGGHQERVRAAERACEPLGVVLAGASYRGVSVDACVADSSRVARAVATRLGVLALCALGLAGCSGGGSTGRETVAAARRDAGDAGQTAAPTPGDAVAPPARGGTVEVDVVWPSPSAELLRSPGRNACGAARPAPVPVAPEAVIADRYATERMIAVTGAVVSLAGGDEAAAPGDHEGASAELALRDCVFRPAVVVVAGSGTALALINDDERRHEIRVEHLGADGAAQPSAMAAVSLPVIGHRVEVPITRPGVVRLTSATDPEDAAYAVVAAHRYVAVTDGGGSVRFEGVPPGAYRVRVWYPPIAPGGAARLGEAMVELSSGGTARARVSLGK